MQYAIVIERSASGFGAYVRDLPGCVAIGETEDEVRELIRKAIEFHLEGLKDVQVAEEQLARGEGVEYETARQQVLARLRR